MRTRSTTLIAVIAAMTLLFAGCGGGDDSDDDAGTTTPADDSDDTPVAGDADNGGELYLTSCQSCHGADAQGVDGLGKPLAGSDFVASTSADDLADFVTTGRPASDPANTTGVDMPPKGGAPNLSDGDIDDLVAYMKSLN